jgi:hypothetical protein
MTVDPQEVADRLARLVGKRLRLDVTGSADRFYQHVTLEIASGLWYRLPRHDVTRAMDALGEIMDSLIHIGDRDYDWCADRALAPLADRIAHECRRAPGGAP